MRLSKWKIGWVCASDESERLLVHLLEGAGRIEVVGF
jgi:hypothetical protein